MTWGMCFKVSAIMDEESIASMTESEIRYLYWKHLSTGRLARQFTISLSNQNGYDFSMNLISVLIKYDVVKIPRIVKKLKSTNYAKNKDPR